jgi:D-methionine transport system permease protein
MPTGSVLLKLLASGLGETLYMTLWSGFFAVLIGLPLGIILYVTAEGGLKPNRPVYLLLSLIVNIGRSVPFIILLIAVIPLTRLLVQTSLGAKAAIVPLSLAGAPFFARLVQNAFDEVNKGLIEAARAFAAGKLQIIFNVLLAESWRSLVLAVTVLLVNLIGYSAMAGAIGAGGLGKIAITYGYNRYNEEIMLITVVLLVVLVQAIQTLGEYIARKTRYR